MASAVGIDGFMVSIDFAVNKVSINVPQAYGLDLLTAGQIREAVRILARLLKSIKIKD
jgi:hypothetical protein